MSTIIGDEIVIVSGLPRSGTSMMMKMLQAGGLDVLSDGQRAADEDNPQGYFEFERVKQLDRDKEWLPQAQGKVVKIIAFLLQHLPQDYRYKILFMQRELDEVLASQRKMMIRRGEDPDKTPDSRMRDLYEKHLSEVAAWLERMPNVEALYVPHREALNTPSICANRVNAFLGFGLDERAMEKAVDSSLYRNRAAT